MPPPLAQRSRRPAAGRRRELLRLHRPFQILGAALVLARRPIPPLRFHREAHLLPGRGQPQLFRSRCKGPRLAGMLQLSSPSRVRSRRLVARSLPATPRPLTSRSRPSVRRREGTNRLSSSPKRRSSSVAARLLAGTSRPQRCRLARALRPLAVSPRRSTSASTSAEWTPVVLLRAFRYRSSPGRAERLPAVVLRQK